MLAAVLESPRRVALQRVAAPAPGAGEVLIRLAGGGICGSELALWEGREWFSYPRAPGEPGHEGWGTIEAVGPGGDALREGARVAFIGSGAHAELAVVKADHCVVLDDLAAAGEPFPGEPLACAVNAFRRSGVGEGDRVAVVGAGFLGLLLVQLCRGVAGELAVISRRDSALAVAERFGATGLWRPGDPALQAADPFDVVIEATGFAEPLELAARLTRVRGRLVIAGYHQDGRRSVDMQLWNWRGLDVINAHERDPAVYVEGMRQAIGAVVEGRLEPGPLLTHRFPLEEIGRAYEISVTRPEGFVKAVWQRG
jgi:NADPH2:quinone reductase